MSEYALGFDAVLDLEEIWDYIADDNTEAADSWIARLFERTSRECRALATDART